MNTRSLLLVLTILVLGCGEGDSARPAARYDGGGDLVVGGPDLGVDLTFDSSSEVGHASDSAVPANAAGDTAVDQSQDSVSAPIDSGNSPADAVPLDGPGGSIGPDSAADLTADLAVEVATVADLAAPDSAARDAAAEGPQDGANPPTECGCTPVDQIPVNNLPPLSFAAYHTQQEIAAYLQSLAAALPCQAQYKVLGRSVQGRDLPYLILNATCQASPPAFFANGTHHGDEPASTEAVLAIPDYLLRQSATDPSLRSLLQGFAFYVLPLVNPDGQAADSRYNANGADINRDYSYPGRSDADSFKTVEAQLIKSLQEAVGFRAAIAFHSGAEEVVWPWCYTGDATSDDSFFTAAGQKAAQAMSFSVFQQSYDDYPTTGEYIDYAYWRSHTLAATFEVSTIKAPSAASLAGVVAGACKGTVAWAQATSDHAAGRLHALPPTVGARRSYPLTAPFDGTDRLE